MTDHLKKNYGSELKFDRAKKGEGKGIKYKWIASANYDYPETIFINENSFWFTLGDKRMIRILRHVLSHEPIHNIINYEIFDEPMFGGYDRLRLKFIKQIHKECPKTWRNYNGF